MEWNLRPQFFKNCKEIYYNNTSDAYVRDVVNGPVCPKCKRDATFTVTAGRCQYPNCGTPFEFDQDMKNLTSIGNVQDVLKALRAEVYVEAQAAAARGEL